MLHPGFSRLGCLLALPAVLSACSRGADAPAPSSAASAPAATATLPAVLERSERLARVHPAELEQSLRSLAAAPGSRQELDLLALRAMLAAYAEDAPLLQSLVARLRDWPDGALQASARVAATCADTEYQRLQGHVREARQLLAAADPATLAAAEPLYRWRLYLQRSNASGGIADVDASALSDAHAALQAAQQLGARWRIALSLSNLASVANTVGSPVQARELIAQALDAARQDPDPMTLNQVENARGVLYAQDRDSRISLEAYTDALDQATRAGSSLVQARGLVNLADYHLHHGNPARALSLSEQAVPMAHDARNFSLEMAARENVGQAKIALGRVAEGRDEMIAALAWGEQHGQVSYAIQGWNDLSAALEHAGDLAGAVAAYGEFRKRVDNVQRDSTQHALLDVRERLEADQRERDIELMRRDNTLKSAQLRQRNLTLALWAALGGCVVALTLLLARVGRRLRHANQALAHGNALLKRQSETDPLTGLANRRHFQSAIRARTGDQGLEASVFLIDIDHFKSVNDVFGHVAGDAVLVEIARRLQQVVRDDDLVVRWGGEEFLVVARARQVDDAAHLAQRLLDLVGGTPMAVAEHRITVSASIGFACLPLAPAGLRLDWERAMSLVDAVLYRAKGHGRNQACGVASLHADTPAAVAGLVRNLDAACAAGRIQLLTLNGPDIARPETA